MPTRNPFAAIASTATGLAIDIIEVTPANADLETALREIRVANGAGGTLRIHTPSGSIVNFTNVQDGERFVGPFYRISLAGTTVTDIVGWI